MPNEVYLSLVDDISHVLRLNKYLEQFIYIIDSLQTIFVHVDDSLGDSRRNVSEKPCFRIVGFYSKAA